MPSLSCFLKNPLSWMSFLGLVLAGFLGHNFFSIILVILVLTLSTTFILNFSNKKPVEKSVEDFSPNQECLSSHCFNDQDIIISKVIVEEVEEKKKVEDHIRQIDECLAKSSPVVLSKTQNEEVQEQEMEDQISQIDEYLLARSSPIILSESDGCLGRSSTSEDSEVDWPSQDHNMFRSPDCSDGSISDEESLIEIALPSGHYIGHNKQDHQEITNNKFNLHKKLPDFASTGSFFKHGGGLMELLAELNQMNEEENLIEIDISIGSIKYPRFEIEA